MGPNRRRRLGLNHDTTYQLEPEFESNIRFQERKRSGQNRWDEDEPDGIELEIRPRSRTTVTFGDDAMMNDVDDATRVTGVRISVFGDVEGSIFVRGGGAKVLISGNVGPEAVISARGGGATIMIAGDVSPGAQLMAVGGGAKVVVAGRVLPN